MRPEEQAAIISVIRRNEEIEIAERQRVGRLVERVEKIKLRANDRGPNCCRLCGDTFGLLGPTRIICEDCKKPVCARCSVDINIRYLTKVKVREIWLCRICSETREMWKKSGAWFFKGLPNYDVPSSASSTPTHSHMGINAAVDVSIQRTSHSCTTTPTRSVRVKKLTIKVNDSSSSDDEQRNEDIEPKVDQTSSTDDKQAHTFQREDSFRIRRTFGSFRSFIDGGERKLSNSFFFNRQVSKFDSSPQDLDTLSTASTIGTAISGSRRESSFTRRGSVSSSWSISDSSSGNSGGTALSSNNQTNTHNCRDPLLGWLEVAISYRESYNTIDCTVVRARDLPQMDSAGLADPYCKLNIITPEGNAKYTRWQRTKTVHKTRNPEFNEMIQFVGVEPEELGNSLLYIVIFDDDKYGHDFLGSAKVCLSTVSVQAILNTSSYKIKINF